MKREYFKPSMAVNRFNSSDNTNVVNLASSISPLGSVNADRKGVAVIDMSKLKA